MMIATREAQEMMRHAVAEKDNPSSSSVQASRRRETAQPSKGSKRIEMAIRDDSS
jgi:hypothetical protein